MMKTKISFVFVLLVAMLTINAFALEPECKKPGAPPECFNKSVQDVEKEISKSAEKGAVAPKYIQEYLIEQFNAGNADVIKSVEKSSNPKVCCEYDCGYSGCRYAKIRKQACSIIGGSSVSSSKCN